MSNPIHIYNTASNIALFINGYHIEQGYGFNYRESIPKTPIYGYNDYEYSKVVRGKGLVQGILVINFVFPGYLTTALTANQDVFLPKMFNYNIGYDLTSPSIASQYRLNVEDTLRSELPSNTPGESKRARAEFIANLISKKDPVVREQTKKALYQFYMNADPSAEDSGETPRKNTKSLNSPLVADSKSVLGNQIDLYYQDPDLCSWFVRFNNVHFTEVSQNNSQAGSEGSSEPLYEVYEFLAKNKEIRIIE